MKSLVIIFMIVLIYLGLVALGIASYVMTSYSLCTIAKRRQIKNPWIAWIPVASDWTMGSIADDYDAQNGMKRKWRVVLITITIIFLVGYILSYFALIWTFADYEFMYQFSYMLPSAGEILALIIPLYIFIIFAVVGALVLETCRGICLYKIYESTVPQKAVRYLLLSLLVPMANAICLMICKDKGYSKSSPLEITPLDYQVNPTNTTQQNL